MKENNTHTAQKTKTISIAEALAIIKENIPEAAQKKCSLEEGIGKYLAEDITALEPSPRYTNSAMDGFAVRWQDVEEVHPDSPVSLKIIGESQAGMQYTDTVGQGEAVRISTGAVVAPGCDTVIRVEDTRDQGDFVEIHAVKCQGQDIRYRGEEFQEGELLLRRGTKITAARAALLASIGVGKVTVFQPCRVAILVTGSELVSVGESIADDQIRDSNMIMLWAAVREAGGEVVSCIRVSDDEDATRLAIAEASADIVLCSGGISVGRHDHVKNAAAANGFDTLFWGIRQKPGKPLYFARRGKTLLFGLPGNPVSAFMCYTHYVRPVIASLNSLSFGWPMVSGEAVADIHNNGKRTNMIRVQLQWRPNGGYSITHAAKQGSHMLTSLAYADGYIILEPDQKLERGERIDVYKYDFIRELV
ncbi:molybdopterin molybdotransferase MoeA [Desulfopila inferna]|uniref:molybdopterin molybdotransferase MoeA n=1 Tax=Desulfopila inferna TaxID=468528 RepID=UPI0019668687|nr:gephyrin-like molybdotransferase Glp [Desulfopila inferna]MBM9604837.1 molybdopterin molybdotransferase MoeA [Desulfopila inferna]